MKLKENLNLKYKLLSFDELVINLDRLSRFKLPEESFARVFYSVLYKCLIYPKYSKQELETLDAEKISKYVALIWNNSVKALFGNDKNNSQINKVLKMMLSSVFKNIDDRTKLLIDTKLSISHIIEKIDYDKAPQNLKLLIKANESFSERNPATIEKLYGLSQKFSLKFPVKKLLIVEGITEEILLPVFAKKLNYDFDKNGIYVLGAGGKTKSPDLYIQLRDRLNIPVVLLFDLDAYGLCQVLKAQLLNKDKIIVINNGEFEDILSPYLIKRSLNSEYDTIKPVSISDLNIYTKMCDNLREFYRTRKLGEFKKAKLSKIVASNVKYSTDVTSEIKNIIYDIIE